jgi:hypothetical protein
MIGYDLLTMEKNITLTMMGFTLSVYLRPNIGFSYSNLSGVTSCVGSVHTE